MNLLLVDDEVFALEALKNAISWEACGIDNLFTCTNITAAQKICCEEIINLIICDIEMPNGSGMELASWISQKQPDTLILFLTCHSDFHYAKEAISYKAFAYLLKPFDIKELTETVTRAVTQIQQNSLGNKVANQSRFEHFWYQIVRDAYKNSTLDYVQWDAKRQQVAFDSSAVYVPVLFYIASPLPPNMEPGILFFSIKNVLSEMFRPEESLPPVIDFDSHCFLLLLSPEQLKDSTVFRDKSHEALQFLRDKFQVTLQLLVGKEGLYSDMAKQLSILSGQADAILSSSSETLPDENPQQVVEKILFLIKENKTITREELAKEVFLSTDYMSKLFKKETGKKLSEYLSEVKVAEAKYLLAETSLSVSKIASSLSYANFSYFSKMFKSETGISPGEYRKRFQKESISEK